MSLFKNIKSRLAYFIVGLILTVVGALLFYADFTSSTQSVHHSISSIPIIMLIIGIAAVAIAFSKKNPNEWAKDKEKSSTGENNKTDPAN